MSVAALSFLLVAAGCSRSKGGTFLGARAELGKGTAQTYAELSPDGSPSVIGLTFTRGYLEELPTERNDTNRCFDLDENGRIDGPSECLGEWDFALPLPTEATERPEIPFQWVGFGWNPEGHEPAGVWDVPHFDVHFYMTGREEVRQIRTGPCGFDPGAGRSLLLINCEDSVRGTKPIPAEYLPKDHIDVGVVVPDMGNHLILSTSPEFGDPPQRFTHTFIYGAFDGHITFFEPMLTREFLLGQPTICSGINQPEAWETAGYYPTEYCIRYLEAEARYTISLEGFEHRDAT
jgi:hypothetical protein